MFAPVDEHGVVHIQFHEPLDAELPTQPKRERIASLVQQYVKLLESYWITDPGNIRISQMQGFANSYRNQINRQAAREILSRAA